MRKIKATKTDYLKILIRIIKWYFNYWFLKKINPLFCEVYITNNCNFKCKMCHNWKLKNKETLSFNLFKELVDDIKGECCHLSLGGGEPLLLPDIIERIIYAKRFVPYVQLGTNGYLLNEKMSQRLAISEINEVSISIDGLRETNDKIRGVKGAFAHALEAINNLKKYAPNINIVVNTIIAPWNIDELIQLVGVIEKLGVFQQFQPISNIFGNQSDNEFTNNIINEDKIKQFVKEILNEKHIINSNYFLSNIVDYLVSGKSNCLTGKCRLPSYYIEILPDGNLVPCGIVYKKGKSFSLRNQRVKEILKKEEYIQEVKKLRDCTLCRQGMYVCYLEPRIAFPFLNFIKYNLFPQK